MSSQDKEKDMLRQFINKAFVTDPSLLKLLVDRIPDNEIANFRPVLYLREAFRPSVEPGKFANIADSLAPLKNRGVDLNTPSVVTIIEPNGECDESYIAVTIPDEKKARRLCGRFYTSNADYGELLRTPPPSKFLSPPRATAVQARLNQLATERRNFNIKTYLASRKIRRQQLADSRGETYRPVANAVMRLASGNGWANTPPTWLMPAAIASAIPATRHTPPEPTATATSSPSMPTGDSTSEIISAIKQIESSIASASASVVNARSAGARHRALQLLAKLEAQKA